MGALTLEDYSEGDKERWDAFVVNSKNGTFLFRRDYMDYHADRYPDASQIAVDGDARVRALLPATRIGDQLISHAGLTYGGFVTDEEMTLGLMLELFEATVQDLRATGVRQIIYKTVPHIYHRTPAEEDLYALAVNGAKLHRRDLLSVIDYEADLDWDQRRRRREKKAAKALRAGVEIRESSDYDDFWQMLARNLLQRHGLEPVHSAEELKLLGARFPEHIRLFCAYREGDLQAGALLYVSDRVCHVQYSASTPGGRELRVLDLLLAHLIQMYQGRTRYFDFGISTERDGRLLNAGLVEYKQQFGARAIAHDFYRLAVPDR